MTKRWTCVCKPRCIWFCRSSCFYFCLSLCTVTCKTTHMQTLLHFFLSCFVCKHRAHLWMLPFQQAPPLRCTDAVRWNPEIQPALLFSLQISLFFSRQQRWNNLLFFVCFWLVCGFVGLLILQRMKCDGKRSNWQQAWARSQQREVDCFLCPGLHAFHLFLVYKTSIHVNLFFFFFIWQ